MARPQIVGAAISAVGRRPFLLGTDNLGRDMLSRLIYGARNTVGIAFLTTAFAFFDRLVRSGSSRPLKGGWIDQVLGRVVDVLMAIPPLIFALMLLAIFGTSIPNLILIIAMLDVDPRSSA